MSLIEKLKAGKANVKIITWPGTDEQIGVAVLTEAEIQKAVFATEKYFKAEGVDFSVATADAYQGEQNTQLLALALVDPEKKTPLFKSAVELRTLLAPGVKDVLIEEVNAWQKECSPGLADLSEPELMDLFERVKKNPDFGSGLSSSAQKQLLRFMASRLAASPKASGSTSIS